MSDLPKNARVVIVGGGIVGCSVAYHLAKRGWTDIVLLEQNAIGGGTTWHAAGMVGRMRTSSLMVQTADRSARLYAELEGTGWNPVGSLIMARTEDRITQLKRASGMAEYFGVDLEWLDADGVKDKWPLIQSDDLRGGIFIPGDGKVVPADTARALANAAEAFGARVLEGARVKSLTVEHGVATGVVTEDGPIAAEKVVLCGGMWSRHLALAAGVDLPLHPVEHHYVVSEPLEGVHDDLPCARDLDGLIYFRSEADAIVLGAFQVYTKPWKVDVVPPDFSFALLEDDWPKYEEPLQQGRHRIPALADAKFPKFVNGPESFTPDNHFMIGETPEVRDLWVAAGFNSVGIAAAGGAGDILASWMADGGPPVDLFSIDVRRFSPLQNNKWFLLDRVTEMLGLHYQMGWPNRELSTGRKLRMSPLYERLESHGACDGAKLGLERPLWFARDGVDPAMTYSFGKQNWFECHGAEHRAAREAVAIFDQTSFSKFVFKGRDVVSVLQLLCGANTDVPVGTAVYTGMFNERGTIESDLTIIRTGEHAYYIVTATGQRVRDFDWIEKHIGDANAVLVDVTAGTSVLGLMGPRSRELLSKVGDTDLSLEAFPFSTAQTIGIGPYSARAVRITYVGELGWELHVSSDQTLGVYDTLWAAGAELGLTDAGHYAINSLRIEKGYRSWGHELSPDDTPLEAGLSFAIDWDGQFLGREALLALKERGLTKRMVSFVLSDPDPMLWGGERIFRDGVAVGYLTSGAYGHTLGGAVGLGYVKHDEPFGAPFLNSGTFEIDVGGERIAAKASLRALYDPKREKILR